MDEYSENFQKFKKKSGLKNIITEMKTILEQINEQLVDTEEQISNLEKRIVEII